LTVSAFRYEGKKYLKIEGKRFAQLEALGNGFYLAKFPNRLSNAETVFYGFMFGLVGVAIASSIENENIFFVITNEGTIEQYGTKEIKKLFTEDDELTEKIASMTRKRRFTLQTQEAFLLEGLRRQGMIPQID